MVLCIKTFTIKSGTILHSDLHSLLILYTHLLRMASYCPAISVSTGSYDCLASTHHQIWTLSCNSVAVMKGQPSIVHVSWFDGNSIQNSALFCWNQLSCRIPVIPTHQERKQTLSKLRMAGLGETHFLPLSLTLPSAMHWVHSISPGPRTFILFFGFCVKEGDLLYL
jgi:hypothetical protein